MLGVPTGKGCYWALAADYFSYCPVFGRAHLKEVTFRSAHEGRAELCYSPNASVGREGPHRFG